jgi:endonuclease/exonuclease/phosphatase family metal-dependent hydrolase
VADHRSPRGRPAPDPAYRCGAVIAEIAAPPPFGRILVACHGNSWPRWAEHERELQALAVVRRLEQVAGGRETHVIVGGDFNATPDAASMRFWTGQQSLAGRSTAYRDCWESVHGDAPGWTFDPANPLTAKDEPGLDQGRRIDHLLVRCADHGPTLAITDCRRALDAPVDGVWPSDHYGVIADFAPRRPLPQPPGAT